MTICNIKHTKDNLNNLHPILEFLIGGGITFASSLFCMWLCQFSCGICLDEITTISAFVVFISIYAIVFAIITVISGRVWLGNALAMTFLFIVTVLDSQIYYFRGTEIVPGDIKSIRTGLSVADQYHPQITANLIIAVLILCLYLVMPRFLNKFRKGIFWRGIAVPVLICAFIIVPQFINNVSLISYADEGLRQNSFPVNFCRMIFATNVESPQGYSTEIIESIEDTYCVDDINTTEKHSPTIIAVMNESFADLNVVGRIDTDEEVIPFYNSLQENTIKGWTQVPVFGAGTVNTE